MTAIHAALDPVDGPSAVVLECAVEGDPPLPPRLPDVVWRGGIDLNFSQAKLLDSVRSYLDDGFEAVKIKVGKPTLAEDVARASAVRDLLGAQRGFMLDANYGYDVDQAIAAAQAFAPLGLVWFDAHPDLKEDFEYEAMFLMSEVMAHTITLHLLDAPGRVIELGIQTHQAECRMNRF